MKTCKNCKHYKKDERIGIIVCEFGLHESYCEKDKEDFAIEELKKIKAEMKELAFLFDDLSPDKELVVDLDNIEEVIDNHISELKGE